MAREIYQAKEKAFAQIRRGTRRVARVISPLFPQEVEAVRYPYQLFTGVDRMNDLMDEGFGSVFDLVHFSYADFPQVAKALGYGTKESLLTKRIITPIGVHQLKPGLRPLTKLLGQDIIPIVNQDTIEDAREKGQPNKYRLGEGTGTFVEKAMEALSKGEHIMIASQGGRRPYLYPEHDKKIALTMGSLFLEAKKHGTTKFAVMPIGQNVPREFDYSKENIGGYNLGKPFRVILGETYTYDEIMNAVGGNFRKVDEYLLALKANLVAETYLNMPSND